MRWIARSLALSSVGFISMVVFSSTATAVAVSTTTTLSDTLTVLAVTIALIFEGALLYALFRYRNSGNAKPPEYNFRLHFSYVIAVGVILIFVGVASIQMYGAMSQQVTEPPPEDAVHIDVTAEQWAWTFEYPNENVTTRGEVVIPENETVYFQLTSRDVIHSFFIPEFNVKQDASPTQTTTVTLTPTTIGEFRLICAEYCGQGHSRMRGTLRVVTSAKYESWLEEQRDDEA